MPIQTRCYYQNCNLNCASIDIHRAIYAHISRRYKRTEENTEENTCKKVPRKSPKINYEKLGQLKSILK